MWARAPGIAPFALVAVGCFSEPMSIAGGDSTGSDATSGAASSVDTTDPPSSDGGSTSAATGGDGSTSAEATSSTPEPSASSTGDSGSDSTGGCMLEPAVLWAEDATLVSPMEYVDAVLLPGTPLLARSYTPEAGTITFAIDLPCATTVQIHVLVWDALSGIQKAQEDPDSYLVSVDGSRETQWTYGCGSGGARDQAWLWQHVAASTEAACDTEALAFDLGAGAHEIVLRNRESGGGLVYAAIAAIVVSDDPTFDPADLYDPGP